MEPEYIDEILFTIIKEFAQPENFARLVDEQVLANAVFYSFAVGALNNEESDKDTVEALLYVINWIEEKEHILKGFKAQGENDE